MRISSSSVSMGAESFYSKDTVKQENLRIWNNGGNVQQQVSLDTLDWSEEAKKLISQNKSSVESKEDEEEIFELSDQDKMKIKLIEDMLSWITGKKVKLNIVKSIHLKNGKNPEQVNNLPTSRPGFGLHYTYFEQSVEQESLDFKAKGKVKTDDGRDISFDFNVSFSRTLIESRSLEIKMGEALCDPLVINFACDIPSLHGKTIKFDIDVDGRLDELPFFSNAGYLAFDKNGDGKINDGSELFGPATQNGFAELSNYDDDKNGWIDENDDIFNKLVVWIVDENGKEELLAASKADVGAIYLGNVDTNLRLLDSQNEMIGNMSRVGLYLKESGGVATIEHIDVKL